MNPWLIIAALIFWVGSLAAVGKWQREDGATGAREACAAKENAELKRKSRLVEELSREVRAWEDKHNEALALVGTNFAKEMEHAEEIRRRDVAAARNGTLRLRVPASVCANAGGGSGEALGPPAPAGHGGEERELPRETVADLLALADDADQVAKQLAACQAVIKEDRRKAHE